MQFMLNQFPRNSRHVSRLPSEDVPIFLEEFGEREFLFGIQIVAYVTSLGRFLRGQRNRLAECVLRLDGHFGGLGRHESVSHLATLPITIKSSFDISPDGDDATWP
jgi:hypothetical protein